MSVREEAVKKRDYHHLNVSMRAVIGKYASENITRNFNFAQLVGVFEIIIDEILCPDRVDRKF